MCIKSTRKAEGRRDESTVATEVVTNIEEIANGKSV